MFIIPKHSQLLKAVQRDCVTELEDSLPLPQSQRDMK